jgi:CubicO group peptidase (beta-lactamase class C family)
MHTVRIVVRTAALLLLAASPLAAQRAPSLTDAERREARTDSVFHAFDRTDGPGCAVGVYRHGAVEYARGYGMANLELGVAISPRTVFDVGSISKQFTAMSILLLAKDGKLSIDDPIRKYIPEMPAYADRITIRQLLSHTSGIRDHFGLLEVAGRSFDGTADTVDYLHYITRSAEPNFEPGTRYLYSNSGFVLLSTIVYRVSGQPLARFAAERIFKPLGMTDTRFQDDHTTIIPYRATAYMPRGAGWALRMSQFDGMAGAGGLHTNVEDFQRWIHNYEQPTVGGPDIVAAMQTATRLNNDSLARSGPESAYGLGLSVGTYRGLRVVSHSGVWGGYRGAFNRFPDQDLTVSTFCNFTNSGPDSLAKKVAAIYLGSDMGPDVAATWRTDLLSAPRVALGTEALRPLTGVWRNLLLGEVRRTQVAGDTLVLQGGGRTPLIPLGPRRFRAASGSEITFEQDSAGMPSRLVVRAAGNPAVFSRVAPAASSLDLAEFAGTFVSPEVDVTYQLRTSGDSLVIWRDGRPAGALHPAAADVFMEGGSEMDFTRDHAGHITGFYLEADRVRHLRFDRSPSAR